MYRCLSFLIQKRFINRCHLLTIKYKKAKAKGSWFPAWLVVFRTPIGQVQILNLHLRPPFSDSGSIVSGYLTTGKIRLEEIKDYYSWIDPKAAAIFMGDFNENKKGQAVRFLEERGMMSVLSQFQPGAVTWRWKTSRQIGKSANQQISKSANRQIGKSANRQIRGAVGLPGRRLPSCGGGRTRRSGASRMTWRRSPLTPSSPG